MSQHPMSSEEITMHRMRISERHDLWGAGKGSPSLESAIRKGLLAFVVAWVAACAHQPAGDKAEPPPVNLSGYSPAFRAGFGDGCDTARGRTRKIDARYAEEVQYRRGWDDGRAICARR